VSLGQIVRLWGSVHYKPDLKFYDHLSTAAKNRLGADFKHWRTDRLSVLLHDTDAHSLINMAHKNIGFECANPQDAAQSLQRYASHVRSAMSDLHVPSLTRMGIKLVVYCDLGLGFDELTERLRPFCLPPNQDLERLTSARILDLALRYDYEWEGATGQVRVGPMRKDQGLQMLDGLGSYRDLFPEPSKAPALSEFCISVPETCLYFDLDVFRDSETPSDAWFGFAQGTYKHIESVFLGITALVKGVS
jgi:hypothetical protein